MTPNIATVGKFKVDAPFDGGGFFDGDVVVISIETFGALITKGKEPFTDFYEPFGLDISAYKADIKDKANIVRFRNTANITRDVPDTYIRSAPLNSGYEYVPITIITQLPPMWVAMSYDHLLATIADMTKQILGVPPAAQKVAVSGESIWLDDIDHNLAMLERTKVKESDANNVFNELARLEKENSALRAKLAIYEKVIRGEIAVSNSRNGDLFKMVADDFLTE